MEYRTLRDDEVEKLPNTHSDLCSNCKVPNISNQIHCKTGGIRKIKIKMMSTRSMKKKHGGDLFTVMRKFKNNGFRWIHFSKITSLS